MSFAPLAALPRLLDLDVYSEGAVATLSDAQVDQLRALPQLHRVSMVITTGLLRRMLRPPHHLQWQELSLSDPLCDEAAFHLSQLPSLTKIDQVTVHCERFDWLRRLPNLRSVDFDLEEAEESLALVQSLVAGLQCCTNTAIIKLTSCPGVTTAQLTDLLPRLPNLWQLELFNLPIDSLSFLAQPPMTDQLNNLRVAFCGRLPLTELRHVHALLNLEDLELQESFNELMDSHCQSLYTPPSALMPQLYLFDYSPPTNIQAQHADDDGQGDDEGDE